MPNVTKSYKKFFEISVSAYIEKKSYPMWQILTKIMSAFISISPFEEVKPLQNFSMLSRYYNLSTVSIPSISKPCLMVLAVKSAKS